MYFQKVNYKIIAITTGLLLVGGTILGSAPMVFADDDHKEKLSKLKDLIDKWKKKKKCPEKFKYGEKCDKKKPKIKITSPKMKETIPGLTIMITGTASDDLSGIDKVLVKIDRSSYEEVDCVPSSSCTWNLTTDLDDGRHFVIAKAIDNVGNSKRTFTFFTVGDNHDDSHDDSKKKNDDS